MVANGRRAGSDGGREGPKKGKFWNSLQGTTINEGPEKDDEQRRAE